MLRTILLLTTLVNCFFLFSCNPDQTGKPTDAKGENGPEFNKQAAKSFIDSVNLKFSAEVASGDSAALALHYWPDAELLLDNSDVVKGGDIKNAWGAVIRGGVKEMSFTTTDITGNGRFLIETGHYEIKNDNRALIDQGKYVVVWEKRNGEWKLYRDIGCTSLPAAK